jgi:23S rRNA (cytosine1962-C5)-methyltransferase
MKTITLKPKAGRRFLNGHPWVFSNELEKPVERPGVGDIVALRRADGQFIAMGFYHPNSLIAFRELTREEDIPVDGLFAERLELAIDLRRRVYPGANCIRLVHSESDGLPGLIVDQYDDVLSIQVNSAGMELKLEEITGLLDGRLSPRAMVYRNDSMLRRLEGLEQYTRNSLASDEPVTAEIEEYGIRYHVDVKHGQKTGLFIDQHDNRLAFRRFIQPGDTVLDAFCNDGGFAFNAAAAGAGKITAIDTSEAALSRARVNASANGFGQILFEKADVMKWLPSISGKKKFDVVNLDPPGFASNRKSVPAARKAYRKLHVAGMLVLKPGGILATACCSHHVSETDFLDSIQQAAGRAGRVCQMLFRGGHPADHPVLLSMPESSYLKFFVFRVL